MTTRRRQHSHLIVVVALAAALALAAAGCGGDDDDPAPDRSARTTVAPEGIDDLTAEARTAALEFFEAQATLDYDAALQRSSGGAARGVEWARAINEVDEAVNTPYEVRPAPSPKTTVSIDGVDESSDGRFAATGFLQIDQRPSLLAAGPIPEDIPPIPTWFVTGIVFTERDGRLVVDDYRMDDSPYPVSQLVAEFDPPEARVVADTTTDAPTAANQLVTTVGVQWGHRDVDGTAQYLVAFGDSGLDLASTEFVVSTDDEVPADARGEEMQMFRDREAGAPNVSTTLADTAAGDLRVLAVLDGGFLAPEGVVRLTFVRPGTDETVIIDAPVRDWPPTSEQPTNEVRRLAAPTTTTSTTTTTTIAAPSTSIVYVPVPGESPGATQPPTTPAPATTPTTTAPPATTTSSP